MTQAPLILSDDWMAKISRLSIATSSKVRGHHKGSHRSQRFGSSLDFSDFREYHVGDDVRQIDWNVFARTDKYFIKRFLDEQEMRVHILLDCTKSMGDETKWLFARQIATSIGLMVLNCDDRLSFSIVSEEQKPPFRRKGSMYRKAFTQIVSNLEQANYTGSFTAAGLKALPKDSTVLFVVTDGLESIEEWQDFLTRLPRFAGDVRIIQIITDNELNPRYTGDVRLIDAESGAPINVSMSHRIREDYTQTRLQHEAEFDAVCRRFAIRKIQLCVEDGLHNAIFHKLLKSRWVQ